MRFTKIFDSLNKKQHQAVEMPRVPVLMLAGPGTGKTRTLISRIIYQIQHFEIAPEHILALTFTNKAAREMQNRLYTILKEKAAKIKACTIHSFCLDILRKYYKQAGLDQYFSVCSDEYQTNLLNMLISDKVRMDKNKVVKGIKISMDQYLMRNKPMPPFSAMIYDMYTNHLQKHKLIDFNQILTKIKTLFAENTDILEQYSFLYQAIHVDEFQDTDIIQYDIIKLLADKHRNIFVVADDDQSIYAWRGANPENINTYIEDFKISTPIFLDINYRSGEKIINAAQAVVKDTERIEPGKKLIPGDIINDSIQTQFFDNEQQEIKFISQKIKVWQTEKKIPYSEIAVLYPQHRFAEKLSLHFVKERIPFQQASGRNFDDDPQIKKVLLYLQVIRDPLDSLLLEELVESELGFHVHKQIQNVQHVLKCGYRKALYEFGIRTEISDSVKKDTATFIGNLANLINLKSFFNFEQLIKQILAGLQDMDKSYIELKAENFSDFKMEFGRDFLKNTIWIYHENNALSFVAQKMLETISSSKILPLEKAETAKISSKDLILLLTPLEVSVAGKKISLYNELDEKRQSSFSTLIRLCQSWLVEQEDFFNNYVVFDLETTGRNTETCGIVEIAAVKVKNKKIVDTFQTLVNPQMEIEQEAIQVHHIENKDVADAPAFNDVWIKFKKFIAKDILIAHNGYAFDFKIVDRFALQMDGTKLTNTRYDSLIFARKMFPNEHNSIDALSEKFKLDPGNRHRALDDVKVLHQIFLKILMIFREKQKKLSGDFLFEYCALANYIENKLNKYEDKVFFLAGVKKLLSPYSQILDLYCSAFGKDIEIFKNDISIKAIQLNYGSSFYTNNDDFRGKILELTTDFNRLPVDKAIAEFLSVIMLINPQDKLTNADAVSLLTFHSAKGLEFKKVIIMGMEDDSVPSFFAYKTDDYDDRSVEKKMDEQKRLLYVGLTRAKDEIILTAAKNRFGRMQKSSPFLKKMFKNIH